MESTQAPIDRIIDLLNRHGCEPVSSGPGQWKSRCPAHKGKNKNLSIKVASDGVVVLHCHRVDASGSQSCPAALVIRELGLAMRDLFPRKDRPEKDRRRPPIKGKAFANPEDVIAGIVQRLGEPSSCWVYQELHDNQRHELMRVYRFDVRDGSKEFRPVHPASNGWYMGDPPGKLPLYGLPEIAPAETVFVTEGESCADLVRSMGLVATTSAHGAKSPSKTNWAPLAGKSVVILPDNDEPGQGYAQAVAELLNDLDPKPKIRILNLPVLEKGHDVKEWMSEVVPDTWAPDDCAIEIQKLAANTPIWIPPPKVGAPARLDLGREDGPPKLTELGNARRLIRENKESICYCYSTGHWMFWDGTRWAPDTKGAIWRLAKKIPDVLLKEAMEAWDHDQRKAIVKWAEESEKRRVVAASIDFAWSEPGIGVEADDFDRDPWILNTPSGIVDLLTGDVRPQKPEDRVSKMTAVAYDPECHCPRWRKTLLEIFDGDEEMIAYHQRCAGYGLTGSTGEHCLFIAHGIKGRNGKNTVLDTERTLLGDYATVIDPRILLTAGQNEHPAAIADLVGRRFVMTSEVDEGQQLAKGLVKRLTGDRSLKARFMYQNPFEFLIRFKIFLLANELPEVRGSDEAIWTRLKVLPFNVFIPEAKRIKNLSEQLIEEEGPGILGWLVEGAREYNRIGLAEPEIVARAGNDYRSSQDVVGDFLAACCIDHREHELLRVQAKIEVNRLYRAYVQWCDQQGEDALTSKKFLRDLTRKGFAPDQSNGRSYRCGLELKEHEEEPTEHRQESRQRDLY